MSTNLTKLCDFLYNNPDCTVDDMHDHVYNYPLPPLGHHDRDRCQGSIGTLLCALRKTLQGTGEVLQATWSEQDGEICKRYRIEFCWTNGRESLEAILPYLNTFVANANQHTTAAMLDSTLTPVTKDAVANLHSLFSSVSSTIRQIYSTLTYDESDLAVA